jgi:lipopolysaccharide biosynthesis regulator YciM
MSKVIFVVTVAVILALSYLALENPIDVQLKFFREEPVTLPLYAIIFGGFLLGALLVYVLFLLHGVRDALLGWRARRSKKRDERIDDYRVEARTHLRLGELEKSRSLIGKAIHLAPENLELFLDLADVFFEGKQYTQASDRYHHVFSRDPENIRALLGIAASNERTENFSDAELYFGRVLAIEKTNPVALKGRFRSQEVQEKWQGAMETLRLLRREDLVSGEEFDRSLAVLWYEQAMTEERAGDLKASISSFEKSLKAHGQFTPSLLGIGEAYVREGSPDRAAKTWESALMEHFQVPLAKALENHMVEHGQEKDLIQFFKKASSRSELARLMLARLYLRQDQIEEAETEINKITDVEASPEALLILAEMEKKRLNEALSNRHYSLAAELLHQKLNKYRCHECGNLFDHWIPKCPDCGAWNALRVEEFLP